MRGFLHVFLLFSVILGCHGDDNIICDILDVLSQDVISKECGKQMSTVCNNPELLWKMFDASSRYPITGSSYGNGFDYGNLDECTSIDYEDHDGRILGKHCSFGLILPSYYGREAKAFNMQDLRKTINKTIKNLISYNQPEKGLRDARVPPDLSKISVCVPDACTAEEAGKYFLYGHLSGVILVYTGLPCETKETNTDFEAGDVAYIAFLSIVVLVMVVSTIYDYLIQTKGIETHHPILVAFSVLTNGKKLLYISKNKSEQIQVFNGMRFISMMWVVAYHPLYSYQSGILGVTNWGDVETWNGSWHNRYILSALVAVDTFFFMTAVLLAYGYLKTATEEKVVTQVAKVPSMVLHRYLRITPVVAALYLGVITVYRMLGSGPFWILMTTYLKTSCKEHWWQFFLYIQNYTNYKNMCILPTWYLSADMQMFVLAPLVLIPTAMFVKKRYKLVMGSLMFLTILSIIIPMIVTYSTKDDSNVNTTHDRFSDYLIGIMFGTFLRVKKDKPFIFSRKMNFLLWVILSTVCLAFLIYWHDVQTNYELLKNTLFMGFYRPIWCTFLSFVVYSCCHGHGGIVNWFLSLPVFQILGRLSYSMYVLHELVEIYDQITTRNNVYFSDYFLFYKYCGHLIVTMILAIFWVLAFEMPMITIEKLIKGQCRSGKPKKKPKV